VWNATFEFYKNFDEKQVKTRGRMGELCDLNLTENLWILSAIDDFA
jgi:hypothetical protein